MAKAPTTPAKKPAPAASTRRRIIDEDDPADADPAAAADAQAKESRIIDEAAATGAATADPAAAADAPPPVLKEDSVIVNVPKAFRLRIDSHKVINYPKGAYSMHKDHASHWFAVASGVTVVE